MRFLSLVFLPILLIQLSPSSMAAPGVTDSLGKGLSYINPMKILEYFPDVEHLNVEQVQILIGKLLEAAQSMKLMKKDYKAKKAAAEKAEKRAALAEQDDTEVEDFPLPRNLPAVRQAQKTNPRSVPVNRPVSRSALVAAREEYDLSETENDFDDMEDDEPFKRFAAPSATGRPLSRLSPSLPVAKTEGKRDRGIGRVDRPGEAVSSVRDPALVLA